MTFFLALGLCNIDSTQHRSLDIYITSLRMDITENIFMKENQQDDIAINVRNRGILFPIVPFFLGQLNEGCEILEIISGRAK